MNHQILLGRKININGTDIEVSSVKPVKGADYITRYCINNGPIYSKVDIGACVSIVESQIEEENRPKGLFSFITNKFGLFKRTFVLDPEVLDHTEKSIFFQRAYGIRKYGYKTVAFFTHIRLGLRVFQFEFCWNEKKEYNKGTLPESLAEFKKVF